MRWGKTTSRWVEYQQWTWPSPQKAKQPDLQFSLLWRIQGRGSGAQPHLPPYFWTNWDLKGEKNFFIRPPLPPSEGLDPPAVCMDICMYPFLGHASVFNFHYSVKYNGCVTNCVVHKFPFGHSGSAMIIIWLRLKLLPTLLESKVFHKKGLKVINCNSFTISFNTVLYCRIIF